MEVIKMIRRNIKVEIYILLSLILVFFTGCTFTVRVTPNPGVYIIKKEKIKLSVGLFIDDYQIRQIHSQSGFCLIGVLHTWEIQTGMALRISAENTFREIFTHVEILKTVSDFTKKPLTLLITPKIERFYISQDLTAELVLYCKLIDQTGKVVYENTIPAKGESQAITGFLFGMWGGEYALSKTSTSAFNKAFAFLASDIIKKVNFDEYLKR